MNIGKKLGNAETEIAHFTGIGESIGNEGNGNIWFLGNGNINIRKCLIWEII